jgi:hypothetical protein
LSIAHGLGTYNQPPPATATPAWRPNLFVSGRELGDEYRYILERRYTKTFPGNLLPRPGLILSPWETRSTDLSATSLAQGQTQSAAAGDMEAMAQRKRAEEKSKALRDQPAGIAPHPQAVGASFDFLGTTSPALYNLVPNEQGIVRIERSALGDRHIVQIYA